MKYLSTLCKLCCIAFLLVFAGARNIHAQTISTYAGYSGSTGDFGDGGPATAAGITGPNGVATDTFGNVYITDNVYNVVRKISATGIITRFAGTGSGGYSGDGGAATTAQISSPQGICADNLGNVYFADGGNYVIRKVDASGVITTVAGTGSSGYSGDGGPATAAALRGADDVAISLAGNLYIADGNTAIRMVNTSGIISTFAGTSTVSYTGDGGAATAAGLDAPTGVAVDTAGNVYVADNFNNVIRKISTTGIITTVAGNGYGAGYGASFGVGSGGYAGDGAAATLAYLNQPSGIAVDVYGNLYIADQYNNVVRFVKAITGNISTYAGDGTGGYTGDGGPATAATLNFNEYNALDKYGNLYIADQYNNAVRKVKPASGIMISTASDTVCSGTSVTYTSTIVGTGTVNYYWHLNSSVVGTDAGTFTADSVHTGDTIYCVLTGAASTDTLGVSNYIVMTVKPSPNAGAIGGGGSGCISSTVPLSETTGGGTWSSSATGIATISTSGTVTCVAAGSATISYSVASTVGCGTAVATYPFTVLRSPTAGTITGSSTICAGGSTALGDTVTGGSWMSGSTSTATVDGSGNVYGVATGSVTITYTVLSSCGSATATFPMTITASATIGAISGASTVCTGVPDTLTDATTGGTWTSSASGIASVSSTGIVTGITAGSAMISYSISASCGTVYATYSVTVIATPSAGSISGFTSICTGSSITLTETASGGAWSSSATGIATVDGSGNVFGVATGSVNIIYTVSNFCGTATASYAETVNATAVAGTITGSASVCVGSAITLVDGAGSGTWSSGTTSVATVDAGGVVSGVMAGSVTISYTVSTVCGTAYATYAVTVNPLPNAGSISGGTSVCVASSVALSETASGGTWSSSATGTATVDGTGHVFGVSGGSADISYTVTTACGSASAVQTETINPAPSAGTISGLGSVCVGSSITLTDGAGAGTWSSGATGTATVTAGGSVTGVAAGSVTISYGVSSACGTTYATYAFVVNPLPNAGSITGPSSVCIGAGITLSDAAGSGTWSSSATSVATVDAAGDVYGVTTGTTNIIYTVTNGCGTATTSQSVAVITVPTAGVITGGSLVCLGASVSLTDGVSGGVWSTSAAGTASVDAGGNVTGVAGGAAYITYTVSNACGSGFSVDTMTVLTSPSVGVISGLSSLCSGTSITLTDAISGGTWSSSASSVASIDPSSGVLNGLAGGSATITYTITNACGSAATLHAITVNTIPSSGTITGASSVCPRVTISLSDAVTGGSWSSSNTSAATITAGGIVGGVAAGTTIISYAVSGICGTSYATATITVNPDAYAGSISGPDTVCEGVMITFIDTVSGGSWYSGNSAVATVNSTGGVTGLSADTVNIIYSVTNTCGTVSAAHKITVATVPATGTITGNTATCVGSYDLLTASISGPYWSSSNTAIATVSTGGVVTTLRPGVDTIYHNFSNSCGSSYAVFIDTVETSISGALAGFRDTICLGDSIIIPGSLMGASFTISNSDINIDSMGVIRAVAAGKDTVTIALNNACGISNTAVVLTILSAAECSAGIANHSATATNMTLYPNPNEGSFTVQLPGNINGATQLAVTNLVGSKVGEVVVNQGSTANFELDVPAGVYFLSGVINGTRVVTKFVVEK